PRYKAELPARDFDRLREQVGAEHEAEQDGGLVVLRGGERQRPNDVPGGQVRDGEEQQAGGEAQPRMPAPGAAQEPEVREGERRREERDRDVVRDTKLGQPVRQRERGLSLGMLLQRPERL